jgi:hypothetical protein
MTLEGGKFWAAASHEGDPFPWCVGTGDKIVAWFKHLDHAKKLRELLNQEAEPND